MTEGPDARLLSWFGNEATDSNLCALPMKLSWLITFYSNIHILTEFGTPLGNRLAFIPSLEACVICAGTGGPGFVDMERKFGISLLGLFFWNIWLKLNERIFIGKTFPPTSIITKTNHMLLLWMIAIPMI